MASEIKVIDKTSGTVIKTFAIEDQDQAYSFAEQMEALGMDIEIDQPSLPETLLSSLGRSETELQSLREEMNEEIDSHHCCDDEIPIH